MRQPPHAEASDEPRIHEGRKRHHDRDGGKGDGKPDAEIIDPDIDLLRRIDEAEQGAEDEGTCQRIAKRHTVGENDLEPSRHRFQRERTHVGRVQRLGKADIHPDQHRAGDGAMKMKISRQLPNSITAWPVPGAMTGTIMNTIMISDMTSAIIRPP